MFSASHQHDQLLDRIGEGDGEETTPHAKSKSLSSGYFRIKGTLSVSEGCKIHVKFICS